MTNSPHTKEVFHLAGDKPDPLKGAGITRPDARGAMATHDFTRNAGHPFIYYAPAPGVTVFLELDVFAIPGQPLEVILNCPRCLAGGVTHALRITGDKKAMQYDPDARIRAFPGWTDQDMIKNFPHGHGGIFSCEPIKCTWEAPDASGRDFGMGTCKWHVAIDRNVVRDL